MLVKVNYVKVTEEKITISCTDLVVSIYPEETRIDADKVFPNGKTFVTIRHGEYMHFPDYLDEVCRNISNVSAVSVYKVMYDIVNDIICLVNNKCEAVGPISPVRWTGEMGDKNVTVIANYKEVLAFINDKFSGSARYSDPESISSLLEDILEGMCLKNVDGKWVSPSTIEKAILSLAREIQWDDELV